MAKRKVTYSLTATTVELAEQAAARAGLSTSAWLDRVARREAVRTCVGGAARALPEALLDEQERVAAEQDQRASG